MAESIVSDLVVKAIEYLGRSANKSIAPYFGGGEQLNELKLTLEMIQARLSDATRRQEADRDGDLIKTWLKALKRVMYRIEDLVEEISFAEGGDGAQRTSGNFMKVVCFLPSMSRSLRMNKTLCVEAENIRKELDSITTNMDRFHFNVCASSSTDQERLYAFNMMNRRGETHSFILQEEVVGRDDDKRNILNMLLECDNDKSLSVVSIVGMGGLGKTTLAQLVYNDKQVQQCFELRCWVCISDQVLPFKDVAEKVIRSICREEKKYASVDEIQSDLRKAVSGKRFLLVMDDVWDGNGLRWWASLECLLRGGKQGSKILVTTRSGVVAANMGATKPYLLGSLPEDKSWTLFKSIAFKHHHTEELNPNLVSIGKEIVKKCGNVPLAIRTIASLLCSRNTEEEWVHFRDKEIGKIEHKENDIMQTLKISYNHLLPQQKLCFAYCGIFPKDYEFEITSLIQLWMAQGFVESLEDGHICYMELLRRCFFHSVNVVRHNKEKCQIHDLMHDLAQMVGDECLLVDEPRENLDSNIRHVNIMTDASLSRFEYPPWLLASQHIRSCLISANSMYPSYRHSISDLNGIFSSLLRLRALRLDAQVVSLPDSIGKLKHLRYLRIRFRGRYLPKGITKLRYLQTLDLEDSYDLEELPRSFYKLTRLAHLRITSDSTEPSHSLIDMPPRFGELTCLRSLDLFVVGENNGLDALSRLNLVGKLEISYKKHRKYAIGEAKMANLKDKKLTDLKLDIRVDVPVNEADELLECLQPPPTLKHLNVRRWNGTRFPNWGIDELPNLVSLELNWCRSCRHLPSFGGLPHIKSLKINDCSELDLWDDVKHEDGEADKGGEGSSSASSSSTWASLKSLQSLQLSLMSKLQSLPSGICAVTTLQELSLWRLKDLKTLPESIGNLTQLRFLQIYGSLQLEALPKSIKNLTELAVLNLNGCPLVQARCAEPDGEDWPLIQHVPRTFSGHSIAHEIIY